MFASRAMFCQSLTVSVVVSKLGCAHFIFVDPGVKINGCYYREVLLSQQLLPSIRQVSGDFFVLHRRTEHATDARQKSCCRGRRPHSSQLICGLRIAHISPVDYKIWGVMQDRVYQKKSEGRKRVERATG